MKTLFLILMVSNLAWAVSYKQTDNPKTIQRVDDGAFIPSDPENRDYIAFLAWQKEGGEILPADAVEPSEPVPSAEERIAALEIAVQAVADKTETAISLPAPVVKIK